MLIWALDTAVSLANQNERIALIVKTGDYSLLQRILASFRYDYIEVVTLDHLTKGQAITVLEGMEKLKIDKNERLLIWCSDSFIENASTISFDSHSNHLILAKMEGTQWSFAKTVGDAVLETAEKVRISEQASVGLYNFETVNEFLNLDFSVKAGNEHYVAPLYNQLIEKGRQVHFTEIDKEKFFSFGTPSELIQSAVRLKVKPDSLLS
jgi:dTDP-glucose pyrophosphorylase